MGLLFPYLFSRYDDQSGEWVGDIKDESYIIDVPFAYYDSPVDPLETYNDEFSKNPEMSGNEPSYRSFNERVAENITLSYEWDAEKKQWKGGEKPQNVSYQLSEDGLTLTYTESKYEYDEYVTKTKTLRKNNACELVLLSETVVRERAEGVTSSETKELYEYNANGQLAKVVREFGERDMEDAVWSNVSETRYTYEMLSIFPTGIDKVNAETMGLRLDGKEIVASETVKLPLYDLSGRKVAEALGRVSIPQAGIYIVRTAKGSCKVRAY